MSEKTYVIRSRHPVDAAALRDPDTPLESLVAEPARRE